MDKPHLQAIFSTAEVKEASGGWMETPEGKSITFYVAFSGSTMGINRAVAIKVQGELLHARTAKGETYVVRLGDVFAGAVEGTSASARKAGFI